MHTPYGKRKMSIKMTNTKKNEFPERSVVLSLDIEDWYHLDYFDESACDREHSLLDGIDVYREILDRHDIPSSFFVLGELMHDQRAVIRELAKKGYDIGVHGWTHERPLQFSVEELETDLKRAKDTLEDIIGSPVSGYRAPCFSLDRQRLDIVSNIGFEYDSSMIQFADHPLYGTIDLQGYETVRQGIYRKDEFFEFEVSTLPVMGKQIPVSGGGYLRIFPWLLMRHLIKTYLRNNGLYVLYIHPFEFSRRDFPTCPSGTSLATRTRFKRGQNSVISKFNRLIALLKAEGFSFTTFSSLRKQLLNCQA